ncbi:MAG: N-acyl amino acid synthase FeeM domain-containing protein [Hyphomicrobium sp.]
MTDDERRALFRLRYAAYRAFDGVEPTADGEYRDRVDDLSTTVHIGAYDGDKLIGCLRLCFSKPGDPLSTLPCAAHYPELKAVKQSSAGALMEVSRFAIDPAISNTSYRTTLYAALVRVALIAAEASAVHTILVATRPEWVRFYQYMLGFSPIAEPALYPPGTLKIALLGGSLAQARLRQRMQNAFFKITADDIASMRRALDAPRHLQDVA